MCRWFVEIVLFNVLTSFSVTNGENKKEEKQRKRAKNAGQLLGKI